MRRNHKKTYFEFKDMKKNNLFSQFFCVKLEFKMFSALIWYNKHIVHIAKKLAKVGFLPMNLLQSN